MLDKKNIKAGNLIKMKSNKSFIPKYWLGKDKQKISCKEKINVLETFWISSGFKASKEKLLSLLS